MKKIFIFTFLLFAINCFGEIKLFHNLTGKNVGIKILVIDKSNKIIKNDVVHEMKSIKSGFVFPSNSSFFCICINDKETVKFSCDRLEENHVYLIMTKTLNSSISELFLDDEDKKNDEKSDEFYITLNDYTEKLKEIAAVKID